MFATTLPRTTMFLTALAFGVMSFVSHGMTNEALAAGHPAAAFVEKLGKNAITSLTVKDISDAEREKRARSLLTTNFDVPTIGRYALGTYWKTASDQQKKDYMGLFENMIVKTYSQRFSEYSGQSFKVSNAQDLNEKDAIVSSQIVQTDGPAVNVEWVVRTKSGAMKVVDVIVEGISMSKTQRSDFSAVIQKGNGDINALLDSMRSRQTVAVDPSKKKK